MNQFKLNGTTRNKLFITIRGIIKPTQTFSNIPKLSRDHSQISGKTSTKFRLKRTSDEEDTCKRKRSLVLPAGVAGLWVLHKLWVFPFFCVILVLMLMQNYGSSSNTIDLTSKNAFQAFWTLRPSRTHTSSRLAN